MLPGIIIYLTQEQIVTGQFMILVEKVVKITRKESETLVDKSIFARNQTLTFSNMFLYNT